MVLAALGDAVAGLLSTLILLYILAIIGVMAFSWFPPRDADSPAYQVFVFLRRVTDPVLEPLRRVIPPIGGVLDLSPTIVLFVLLYVRGQL